MDITKRDTGIQVEWRGLLLTLNVQPHHGISGSVAVKDKDGNVQLLSFHGSGKDKLLPFHVHEEKL